MSQALVNASNDQLQMLKDELENYFENTIIPQLFVDAGFILRKFTPPAMKQFTLTSNDIGKRIHDVIGNIRYPTLVENITEVIDTGVNLEKEVQTTDRRWFQMNILPYIVRKENRTNGVIITFVDITNRIATLQELEKANAGHDTFIYAIAHDIKQPLLLLTLLSDILTNAYNNSNTEKFNKAVETLDNAAQNIKILLDDFTNLIKNKNETPTQNERLNIGNIYEDVTLALKDDIYNNQVTLSTRFDASEIKFSRKNLRSIVYNLLSNAIKYKKPGRPLNVLLTTKKIKDYIRLCIHDDGLGIDKEHQQTIFQKFTRVSNSGAGIGLGLYIVRTMMKNNGGRVELESMPGHGSTFKLFFKS